ncbi:lipopolysaccharide biosynthesis protein [Microbacterium sp.]|uniref:lipopolysaccharide biosynthesis protein n=1 Tax=Microbacterium sp. TaxID=51671 RepID=UPI003C764624
MGTLLRSRDDSDSIELMASALAKDGGSPSLIAIGRYISITMSLLTVPIIARALGPDGRGVSATMIAVITIATVFLGLGVPLVLRRRIAVGEPLRPVLGSGRAFAAITLLPAIALGLGTDAVLFSGVPLTDRIAFLIAMAMTPLSVSWAQDVSVLVATRQFRRMGILGVLQSATMFAGIVLLWLTSSLTVAGVVYASTLGNLVAFTVGICWLRSGFGGFQLLRLVIREGWTLIGAQLADVGTRRLDQVIALPLLGPVGAGLYSVAATISGLSTPIAHATAAAMFNGMTGDTAATDGSGARSMRYGFALGTLLVIPLAVASYVGIPIVFGEDFSDAILPTVMLCLAVPATISTYCGATWMAAQKRGLRLTIIQVVTLGILVVGFVVLGLMYSVTGAALGVSIALFVSNGMVAHAIAGRVSDTLPRPRDVFPAIKTLIRS